MGSALSKTSSQESHVSSTDSDNCRLARCSSRATVMPPTAAAIQQRLPSTVITHQGTPQNLSSAHLLPLDLDPRSPPCVTDEFERTPIVIAPDDKSTTTHNRSSIGLLRDVLRLVDPRSPNLNEGDAVRTPILVAESPSTPISPTVWPKHAGDSMVNNSSSTPLQVRLDTVGDFMKKLTFDEESSPLIEKDDDEEINTTESSSSSSSRFAIEITSPDLHSTPIVTVKPLERGDRVTDESNSQPQRRTPLSARNENPMKHSTVPAHKIVRPEEDDKWVNVSPKGAINASKNKVGSGRRQHSNVAVKNGNGQKMSLAKQATILNAMNANGIISSATPTRNSTIRNIVDTTDKENL